MPLAIVVLSVLVASRGATADSVPVPAGVPWTNQAHDTPLELLAGRIATHIAGHPVTVDCESAASWATLAQQIGVAPGSHSGYVATLWNSSDGQLISSSNTAQLAPSICGSLDSFAVAASKPTECSLPAREALSARAHAGTLVLQKRARASSKASASALWKLEPCYLGGGKTAAPMTAAFWANYSTYAVAILTLAHESIHLQGIVGGTLANGVGVGDRQAEAKADCYGMQWMPYVAEQLGDTPADAQAIASYFWDKIYPLDRAASPAYWSGDCRPGGALDIRSASERAWP